MDRELTQLEKGICVKITREEWDKLLILHPKIGYLTREAYPEFYLDIAKDNELGRVLVFRFFLEE